MLKTKDQLFFLLSFCMAFIVVVSNYLVQFPVSYFNLEKILTYGAFTYPIAFLITDLSNRRYGKAVAKKIVYLGFFLGVFITLFFSTNFIDLISIRIAAGSGIAFLVAQLIDVNIFDIFRNKVWFVAPLTSSLAGSIIDSAGSFTLKKFNYAFNLGKSGQLLQNSANKNGIFETD